MFLPKLEVEISGLSKRSKIEALIDTGFTGFLCIPVDVAKELGLILCGEEKFELANGQWVTQLKFRGQVHLLNATQEVEVIVSDSETAQIGVLLLENCILRIDFKSGKVQLKRA
jgi:clan AA aspartic protease